MVTRNAPSVQHAAQPQTGTHLQGCGHPHYSALFLDSQLIRLNLAQVPRLLNQMLMDLLTLLPTRACQLYTVHSSNLKAATIA